MALIDKASLLFVPSVVVEGKAFNILPSGNRAPDSTDQNSGYDQTRADFDFDRGSNAAATRIDENGVLQKYRENLLLRSNAFDTTWDNQLGGSITSGQEGYDGTSNAWLIEKNNTSYRRIQQSVSTSGVFTYSVYAKAGTTSIMNLRAVSAITERVEFDLSDGTIVFNQSEIDAKIEAVGTDGWYRCSITRNEAITMVQIYIEWNETIGDKNIYIQNAQLESGLVSTDYLDSTDVTGKAGVLVDLPRINFDANGENGSLLLEPSRQNLVPYSEWFGASNWVKLGAGAGSVPVISHNYATSPEGVQNATRVQLNLNGGTSSSDQSLFYDDLGAKTGDFTRSVYIKSLTSDVDLYFGGTLNDKKIITATTEWQRFDFKSTLSAASLYATIGLRGTTGSSDSADILVYGFQAEAGSYPSSYIPNHGESGGVTRAADVCNNGGSAESINSTEGVLYAEISALVNGGENRVMSISDGSYQNSVRIQLYTNTNEIEMRIVTANSVQALQRVAITNTLNFNKIAVKYKANDFQLWVNGSKLRFDTNGTMPAANTFDTFNFDDGDGNGDFYGNVKQVAVFNEALSDSELATLTTL